MNAPTPTAAAPRFSVVVPTRHRLDLLALCLGRLAPGVQTLDPVRYEVIVTDDGVAPTAETLVRDRFPWARWTAGPRRGPSANRNHGARLARGAWLAFTDDDCLPDPGWLTGFTDALDAGAPAGVLEGRTRAGEQGPHPLLVAPVNEEGGFLWSCNLAVSRELFTRLGGFDEGFKFPHLEDVDFRLRLGDAKEPSVFVPAALVIHPRRPVLSILRQTRLQESNFHLARKRGVSLAAVNFSPAVLARAAARNLLACRSPREFLTVAWRSVAEMLLLVGFVPVWLWRYRKPAPAPVVHLPRPS